VMTAITFHTDGHVRIMKWQGREQPFTVWVGEHVELFTAIEDKAKRVARKHRAA